MISAKELMNIPRKTASQVLASVPGGRGYDDRLLRAVEEAMLLEWWRGYHAGLKTAEVEDAQKPTWVCSTDHPWKLGYPTPVIHPAGREVSNSQRPGYPGGDIVTMECAVCGHRWDKELPQ